MIDPTAYSELIDRALAEDIGFCDLTSELVIPETARAELRLNARQDLVVAGIGVAMETFRRCAPDCRATPHAREGDRVKSGTSIADVAGPARGLLSAERTALNFLQHLSGVATLTAQYAECIAGTRATLIDTRKTIPGLRALEKHATPAGGARNHRLRLDDGILIKGNHIGICGSIAAAVPRARDGVPTLTKIQIECDTLVQVEQALAAGADAILLDNMNLEDMRKAVALSAGRVALEASGGVKLETIRAIAETGVDCVSVGRLNQSAPAVDIGADVVLHG
ncbi:MAG: carboxylating nicotinate-nucleotide diphosphorylase [Betaproteobacteria bacterium]|nr:carboxylating nicotinate-nucleotide diphosphorylase [Betaproteobacteria bacterium]